jgi:type III restriction enzyme
MKLKFDSGLEYQIEAIKSVTDLFEGLPQPSSDSQIDFGNTNGDFFNELGIGNSLTLSPDQLLKNLHVVQSRNNVPKSRKLIEESYPYSFPNFSIEMETGTGKTYVICARFLN